MAWEQPRSLRSVIGKTLVLAIAVVEIVVWLFLSDPLDQRLQELQQPAPDTSEQPSFASVEETNERGGFTFRYPKSWAVEETGSASKLFNGPRDVVVAMGPAPSHDVLFLSDSIQAEMLESYDNVVVTSENIDASFDAIKLILRGRATNSSGVPLRFVALALEGTKRNYVMTGFTAAGPSAKARLDRLVEIASTLRCEPVARGSC